MSSLIINSVVLLQLVLIVPSNVWAAPIQRPHQQQQGTSAMPLPPELLFESSCKKVFISATNSSNAVDWGGGCECSNTRRLGRGGGIKCCCVGQMATISEGISGKAAGHFISKIFLFNTSLVELSANSLAMFPNLEELFVDSCLHLERVDSNAFRTLHTIRKIRISNCQNLAKWKGTMLRDTPRLQALIVRNNALLELPNLEMESAENVLPIERIDFSGNCIGQIGPGSMRNVAAKTVILNGNGKQCLRTIGARAFAGSKFVSLHLSENPRLNELHSTAFAGLLHLEHLDLSGTSITTLPHAGGGLRQLKRLTLRSVPRLKKLPPVLAFPNLAQAEFTYSYHCCFFKYASRDFHARKKGGGGGWGEEEDNLEQNYREIQRRMCKEGDEDDDGHDEEEEKEEEGTPMTMMIRRLRRRHIFIQDGGDSLFKDLAEWYKKVELVQPQNSANRPHPVTIVHELKPFSDDELGKGIRLVRKCDRTAIDRFYMNITCSPKPDALNPCEDIVSSLPLRIIIWPMWLGSILGNLAVWAVIWAAWQRKMRLHYLFMLNLSFADFLTGVYLAFLAITDMRTANEYYNYAMDWQTGNGCALAGFLSVFASQLSIFSMLMIALEIFYNSRFAFYGRRLSPFWAGFALLFGYVYSLGMAILPLLGISSYQHSSICLPLHIQTPFDRFYLLIGLSLSGFAFGAMVILYLLLNWTLRHSKATSITRAEEDRQILRRTLVLIGTDMLCWVPTLFFGLTAALGWPLITLSRAKWCLVLFYPINSCANPLLYVFLTRTWRDAKRKAGPLIRRSLAAPSTTRSPRETLTWNRFEQLYSTGPKMAEKLLKRMKANGEEDEENERDEEEKRAKTIHGCQTRRERKMLLEEIFTEEGRNEEKGMKKEEANDVGGVEGKGTTKRRASADAGKKRTKQRIEFVEPKSSSEDGNNININSAAAASSLSIIGGHGHGQSTNAPRPKPKQSLLSLPRSKISAPPQMSDISESSTASFGSSNHPKGGDEEGKKKQNGDRREMNERRAKTLAFVVEGGKEAEVEEEKKEEKEESQKGGRNEMMDKADNKKKKKNKKPQQERRRQSNKSEDGDSGRGDSLRSWAIKTARPSVVTICWETIAAGGSGGNARSPLLLEKCAEDNDMSRTLEGDNTNKRAAAAADGQEFAKMTQVKITEVS